MRNNHTFIPITGSSYLMLKLCRSYPFYTQKEWWFGFSKVHNWNPWLWYLLYPVDGYTRQLVLEISTLLQYKHEVNGYLTFFVSVVLLFNFLVINITKCYDLQLREKEVLYHQLEIETTSCLLT